MIVEKFSVLMSTYKNDNPLWLKEAIDSVYNQTIVPNEMIIVHDGKVGEELISIVNDCINQYNGIRFIGYEENHGLGYALNYGLKHCNNDIVARMDSDDICATDRFEKELKILKEDQSITIVGSNVYEFIDKKNNIVCEKIVPETNKEIIKYSKKRSPFNHPSVMFRKKDIESVGSYIELHRLEDYYLWYRLLKSGFKGYNIQENLLYMRTTDDFYARRGKGVLKSRMSLNRIMLHDKYINVFEYVYINIIYIINACIPNFIRKIIYKGFFRKKVK